MNYSIYHIENDVDCKVLKFGIEICIAKVNEDIVIHLLKGRHKLTFQSVDNIQDQYSIIFEVPEAGIEDFINVKLSPIREERLRRESQELEEQNMRQVELERLRKEEEKQRLVEIEKKRQEAELAKKAELKRLEELRQKQIQELKEEQAKRENGIIYRHRLNSARSLYNKYCDISGYEINASREHLGLNWRKDAQGLYCLCKYGKRLTESNFIEVSRFSCGLARVRLSQERDFCYVDYNGNIAFGGERFRYGSHFYDNEVLVIKNSKWVIIDIYGGIKKVYLLDVSSISIQPQKNKGVQILYEETENSSRKYTINVVNEITRELITTIAVSSNRRGGEIVDYGYCSEHFWEFDFNLSFRFHAMLPNDWLYIGFKNKHKYFINACGRIIQFKGRMIECYDIDNQVVTFAYSSIQEEVCQVNDEGQTIKEISWESFKSIRETYQKLR